MGRELEREEERGGSWRERERGGRFLQREFEGEKGRALFKLYTAIVFPHDLTLPLGSRR